MPDGLALPALALLFAGVIALALVWPQGQGARSPAPFGHPVAAIPAPLGQIAGKIAAKAPLALRGPETLPKLPAKPSQPAAPKH